MADERDLDADIRKTLENMAARPAPDRLLDKVAAIPAAELTSAALRALRRPNPSRLRLGFSLASAAIVAIVISGALYFRGGLQSAASQTTPPASASSIAAETASATPASSTLSATPTPAPSVVAVVPSPSPTPSPTSPDAIPPDFQPLSVTFVSADMGWVLGSAGCGSNTCPVIVRTLDGGRTWARIAAPQTSLGNPGDLQAGSGISEVRFADPLDGWAFGPGLWSTHDGGKTWKQISIPRVAGGVAALEASAGAVQLAAYGGDTSFVIASSLVASDAWKLSSVSLPAGAGPAPEIQLVLQGQTGWILENDRVVTGGARLVGGKWQIWQPPCLDVLGPATLAAANAQELNAICTVGVWGPAPGGQQGEHLYRSSDGGQTFVETGPQLAVSGQIAAPSPSTIVATGGQSQIVVSADGGLTWKAATVPAQFGSFFAGYLGFTTPTQGVLITSDPGSRSHMLMTWDGGRTWSAVQFCG
jgi:photosystem II stability/assembly factor-like uncharacterized protein